MLLGRNAMTTSCIASWFGQHRVRGQQWSAVAAAVILSICLAQQGEAQVTIQVNTTQQGVTAGQCSLQEAIYAAQLKSNKAVGSTNPNTFYNTGCVAGTGIDDTIELPAGAVFAFDHSWEADLHNIYGPTATPVIFSKITIEGNGATLRWSGDTFSPGNSRLFAIGTVDDPNFGSGTGDLTLRNVYVKDFHIKGGNGGKPGGGGGLGAGGAIFNEGRLTVIRSTFENNGAVGGRGGISECCGGGGGGGLSGNGGVGAGPWSGGGGGGSRGDGGIAGSRFDPFTNDGGGGGGGGNVLAGGNGQTTPQGRTGGPGGFRCGGSGGSSGGDGRDAFCVSGGGGGASGNITTPTFCGFWCYYDGGNGNYGGGGGGGTGDGGHGGFGGGGGGGSSAWFSVSGGNGGFGGGGGGVDTGGATWTSAGKGGRFGGRADGGDGGGGGALGGAIFSRNGDLEVRISTFFNNYVTRGQSGGGQAANGADAGGAIFSLGRSVEIRNSTFSGNQATGSGAAIVVYRDNTPVDFTLNDTIIANNGANECFFTGSVTVKGAGNLIMQNGSGTGQFSPCPGVVTTANPLLQPLQLNNPGNTPTMAILPDSPAVDKADPTTALPQDQRGVSRPRGAGFDIGAFEVRSRDDP